MNGWMVEGECPTPCIGEIVREGEISGEYVRGNTSRGKCRDANDPNEV